MVELRIHQPLAIVPKETVIATISQQTVSRTSMVKLQSSYKGVCVNSQTLLTDIHLKCAAELQSMIKQFSLRVRAVMGCGS